MKSSHRILLDTCFIITFIFLWGWFLGIFGGPVGNLSGFPKGDDAHTHSGWTLFFLENWPYANWYPNWYGGFSVSLSYHPLAYYVWALFVVITGSSVQFTLFFFSALSYCLTGIGLYGLIYKITRNHDSALIAPLLLITSIGFLGLLTAGGAYTRVFATGLWMLSLYFLLEYIKTGGEKRFYLGTVILIAGTITSNMLIGFFAVLTIFLMLFFCIRGWKEKFFHLLKIFIPTATLSAFFYIPFLFVYVSRFVSFGLAGNHYSTPIRLVNLFSANPLPLLFLFIGILIVTRMKIKFEHTASGVLKALKVLILFCLFFGFLDLPSNIRFFASHEATYFLPIYLSIYASILLGAVFTKIDINKKLQTIKANILGFPFRLPSIRLKRRTMLFSALLLVVISLSASYHHMLMRYVVDPGAESFDYPAYAAEQLLKIDPHERNFRLATDWIHIIRWFNYRYDVPQTSGAHAMAIPYPEWYYWFDEAVFVSKDNWQETNFLLDWFGVKWLIVREKVAYLGGGRPSRNDSLEKFLGESRYYQVESMVDVPAGSPWEGPIYQFEYKFATPIISPTDATTLLIIGESKLYENIFYALAYANYNERHVIPIRGYACVDDYGLEELKKFDVLFVALYKDYYHDFDKAWNLLCEYVEAGGGLIIDTSYSECSSIPLPSPVNKTEKVNLQAEGWNFTEVNNQVTSWVDFLSFSSPTEASFSPSENVYPWARTVLWSHGCPIVVTGEYGEGRVLWNGLGLPDRVSDNKNFMESLFLSKMIDWVSKKPESISDVTTDALESTSDWSLSWTSSLAQGNISLDSSIRKKGNYSLRLEYNFTDPTHSDQVSYMYNPPNEWDWSNGEFFSMWVYGDGTGHELTVYLEEDLRNYYWFKQYLDWIGWRRIVYRFSEMDKYGFVNLSTINRIEITINDSPDETTNITQSCIYIDDISVGARTESLEQLEPIVERSSPEKVAIKVNNASGVLFKESYFDRWHAYLVNSDGTTVTLNIYRAGPDFMYVNIPEGTKFPAEVVFEYRIAEIEWLGYFISLSTLALLITYGLGLPVDKPFRIAFNKIRLVKSYASRNIRLNDHSNKFPID